MLQCTMATGISAPVWSPYRSPHDTLLESACLQYDHGKYGGTCRYVSGTDCSTLLVAAIPVPASPSGGHNGQYLPAESPVGSSHVFAPCFGQHAGSARPPAVPSGSRCLAVSTGTPCSVQPAHQISRTIALIIVLAAWSQSGTYRSASPTPTTFSPVSMPVNIASPASSQKSGSAATCWLLHLKLPDTDVPRSNAAVY